MQIGESRKLLLSDTLLPDLFILEYLPALNEISIKVYLLLLLSVRTNRQMTEDDLARRLGQETDIIHTAFLDLAKAGLIELGDKNITLVDLKSAEIDRIYRLRTATLPTETDKLQQRFDRREKLMADIARTFFQGLMSPSWYSEIDAWFDQYGFEPEVIYALFQECARRNKLDSKGYIRKVADNWHKQQIVSFSDLNRYFIEYEKTQSVTRKIGRKLRKVMTEYDEEMVTRWLDEFGFEFPIIELALRKTTRIAQPNMAFIDRILQEWFEQKLEDEASINTYEKEKAAQIARQRQVRSGAKRDGAEQANFEQRTYSEDYLDSFYREVPAPDQANGPDDQPQTMSINELMQHTEKKHLTAEPGTGEQVHK